jgi:DNA mismatch repair protein MLH3
VEQKELNDRLWDNVKTGLVGLLLSWGGCVSLRTRDADNRVVFSFNTSDASQAVRDRRVQSPKTRSPRLTSMLNTLTQADYVSISQWSTWVPVSASTTSLSIKGAISLEPAPTRNIQFISLGIRPLATDDGNNEIYSEVDRLFRLSSFGAEEEDAQDEHNTKRRQIDESSKTNDYTHRQLKVRKGVDRHPMFHLRINLRDSTASTSSEDDFIHDETNVQTVVEVLGAMITQWLKAHHFRPVRTRQRRRNVSDSNEPPAMSSAERSVSTASTPRTRSLRNSVSRNASKASTLKKRKQFGNLEPSIAGEKPQNRAFADWSRIKTGRADFFCESFVPQRLGSLGDTAAFWPKKGENLVTVSQQQLATAAWAKFATQPLAQGCLSTATTGGEIHADEPSGPGADSDKCDESIVWMDPVTKKAHLLNARTGCAMPFARTRPTTDPSPSTIAMPLAHSERSVRLPPKTATAKQTPWLNHILQSWKNPVFQTNEQRIEQFSPQEQVSELLHQHRSSIGKGGASNPHPVTANRLSKDDLLEAEVLAQVDKKFILVRTKARPNDDPSHSASTDLLVLIDQHAADERIQVETLLRQLCSPAASTSGYQSKLGHRAHVVSVMLEKPLHFTVSQQERSHFTTHASKFACWGILFDIAESVSMPHRKDSTSETSHLLSVTALPPSIAERCRADTQLLISFLRSTVWNYTNGSKLPSYPLLNRQEKTSDWVGRLADCPAGLIDMVNSRACRSAIMFNDELDTNQCTDLVRSLATCAFPFMCAHGRPSMVPLVDIGKLESTTEISHIGLDTNRGEFVQAWKQWKS